ncbi:UPF0236 family transposase-like protein [Thermoanaerobacter wiegelii]|uniref:UPF0236 family transposase-like protein n=1 Tax=Thermoanaerobacter wiegelii TaxID=46354 RepID=UPI0001E4FB77|nr:UPF0236 family protein [Thermoanaerobacter wiegelii]
MDIRHIVGIILLFVQGLMRIIRESKDFYELERGIHELTQGISKQLLEWIAEEMDRKLMENREKRVWEVIGFRAKQRLVKNFVFPFHSAYRRDVIYCNYIF